MAAAKKNKANVVETTEVAPTDEATDAFVQTLIKDLNKDFQQKIAWNLSTDESPTHVKRWISTGSKLLDYAIANRRGGGFPEGRIVELYGPPSIGKSHIATQVAKSTQRMGGIVVYIDTENATNPENLAMLGVDVSKRFIYSDPACTEDVFSVIESTIEKVKQIKKDIPVTIIWDSLAAVPPKAELLADYDKDSIGLQARALSKGMRKVTQVIANNNVLLLILNQTRTKIGVMYGDPTVTPGGSAVPFHASVRISLTGGSKIDNGKEEMIGINVIARTSKNKVARPYRKVEFQIHFGKGIVEHEQIFDIIRGHCEENGSVERLGKLLRIEGTGAWKTLTVCDAKTGEVEIEKKFTKNGFGEIMSDPAYSAYVDELLDAAMTNSAAKQTTDEEMAKSAEEGAVA
jgi:recombination protein RecA